MTTYDVLFSEDSGKTWRQVGITDDAGRIEIEKTPTTGKYRRRFMPHPQPGFQMEATRNTDDDHAALFSADDDYDQEV